MKHVLALDQGTTSSRAIVFTPEGEIRARAQREFTQHYPRPGWVEHDPREIWASQAGVAAEALARAGLRAREIAAIGITNQRETTLLWDRKTGEPLGRAIVWQDRRTADRCAQLRQDGLEEVLQEKTGLLADPYFAGTKLEWMLDQIPGARERAEGGELAFGTVDTWLLWNLTGGKAHATDASNASRTLLMNLRTGEWDEEMLGLWRIPRAVLPEIRASSGVFGEAVTGGLAGIPVAGMAGDQQAALFGQACLEPGMAKNTYGTGSFLLLHTGTEPVRSRNRLLTTVAWNLGGQLEYALEGSVFIAGALIQWLRDGLQILRQAEEVEALAAQAEDNGGVYLVPAFTGLGAPYWDAEARGLIIGLTRGTTQAHLARAALESIALQSRDVLEAMERDAGIRLKELRVDGGASTNNLLMQLQADLLGCPVVRPRVTETTALGAAALAALGVGLARDRQEVGAIWRAERRFEPRAGGEERARIGRDWKRAVERARGWAGEV